MTQPFDAALGAFAPALPLAVVGYFGVFGLFAKFLDKRGEVVSGWNMRHVHLPARVAERHSETAYTTDRAIEFMRERLVPRAGDMGAA